MLETLNNKGYISVEELSKKLYVSLATIRRDLNELEKMVFLKELMVVLLLLVKTT
ncbi:DeoR family transcriptional regulator [Coprobacillaceae bacterium CR2/5/TPMF4]|nr:DeoR family transcriptional regulator [Coprobacillaceae bacterium CR2/5/TPMF4]